MSGFLESFDQVVPALLRREDPSLHRRALCTLFEVAATHLLQDANDGDGYLFDGVYDISVTVVSSVSLKLRGGIWVGISPTWKTPFEATFTARCGSRPNGWISLQVGSDRVEGSAAETL